MALGFLDQPVDQRGRIAHAARAQLRCRHRLRHVPEAGQELFAPAGLDVLSAHAQRFVDLAGVGERLQVGRRASRPVAVLQRLDGEHRLERLERALEISLNSSIVITSDTRVDAPVRVDALDLGEALGHFPERTEILQIAELYSAKVVDYGTDSLIIRIVGAHEKLDVFLDLLSNFNVVELVRSGKVLMTRGLATT